MYLALAHLAENGERWFVVSDEPTSLTTLDEYGLRFDIEENFLDDKSNGFQLESSLIRSAAALTRLGFVLAITTLYLVAQGTEVVKQEQAPLGRRPLVPRQQLPQDRLELGPPGAQSRLGALDQAPALRRT